MSYRKPAPIYVPSPPSSPPIALVPLRPCVTTESEIPPVRWLYIQSDSANSNTVHLFPQLPNDWREAINHASAGTWKNSTVQDPFSSLNATVNILSSVP
jgi:hypothetical protein